jgi:hypothetical protein
VQRPAVGAAEVAATIVTGMCPAQGLALRLEWRADHWHATALDFIVPNAQRP